MVRDLIIFKMLKWNAVFLDEAQDIKNPFSERALSIKKIPRKSSFAVTGTPMENSLSDIWSILDFCYEGYLGILKVLKINS